MKSERILNYSRTDLQAEKLDKCLAELESGSFKVIRLIDCNLGDAEAKRIANVLSRYRSNKKLRHMQFLDLRHNYILATGKADLLKASKGHPKRLKIDLTLNYNDEMRKARMAFAKKVDESVNKMLKLSEKQALPSVEVNVNAQASEEVVAIASEGLTLAVETDDTFNVPEPSTPAEDDWVVIETSKFAQNTLFSPRINLESLVKEEPRSESVFSAYVSRLIRGIL